MQVRNRTQHAMAWHDMDAFLDGARCRPIILKGAGFDLKTLYVPFLSNPCFGSDIFARLFIASPFIEKRAIYIHHGVRAGWPSSTFHTAQDDVKRLLEEFAAYTLAIAKAEVGGMQIRMLYNCVLVNHKFLGRVSSCNCTCVVGAYGTSRHLFYLS